MVTKEQAMREREFHFGKCTETKGPRGGITRRQEVWRSNGQCKTWKTRPEEFQLPIKYGLRECSYLTEANAAMFHVASECPLLKDDQGDK